MFDTPIFELDANNGPMLIRISSAVAILSTLAICLRFYAKQLVGQEFLWDDALILLALPFSWAVNGLVIYGKDPKPKEISC